MIKGYAGYTPHSQRIPITGKPGGANQDVKFQNAGKHVDYEEVDSLRISERATISDLSTIRLKPESFKVPRGKGSSARDVYNSRKKLPFTALSNYQAHFADRPELSQGAEKVENLLVSQWKDPIIAKRIQGSTYSTDFNDRLDDGNKRHENSVTAELARGTTKGGDQIPGYCGHISRKQRH
eukprot:g32.t1